MLTFLDHGGRAEAHRAAASAYKNILRDFEEAAGLRRDGARDLGDEVLGRLKTLLSEADGTAPTVPVKRGKEVEQEPFVFVGTAEELTPSPGRSYKAL